MVLFNYTTKEMTAKVVYYGPGLCGKTTNLQFVYENLPPQVRKGKMLSLATKTDRTLFFDFLPLDLGEIRGMKTRVQLYTVPGQVFYNSTRKLVLRGVDGVVFVADSQQKMMDANIESYNNLEENLNEIALTLEEVPLVMQFNKRDLPSLASIEEMNTLINRHNAPFYESVATTGIGVEDTLKAITKLVLNHLANKYQLEGSTTQTTASKKTASESFAGMGLNDAAGTEPAPPDISLSSDLDLPEEPVLSVTDLEAESGIGEELGGGLEGMADLEADGSEGMGEGPQETKTAPTPFQSEEDWLPEIEPLPESTDSPAAVGLGLAEEGSSEAEIPTTPSTFDNLLGEQGPEGASLDILDLPSVDEELGVDATRAIPTEPLIPSAPAETLVNEILAETKTPDVLDKTISPLDPLGLGSETGEAVSTPQAVHIGDISPGMEHQITVPLDMSVDGRPMRLQLRMTLTVDDSDGSTPTKD